MKKFALSLFCFFLVSGLFAQYKVKEKSQKEIPSWVNSTSQNHFIISATASTIEAAKEKIHLLLCDQIAKAIATKILSQTTLETRQENVNENYVYAEEMRSTVTSKVANIPLMKNISLSKSQDYYWEKLYDKKKKEYFYEYHIKYLFSTRELEQMTKVFNDKENALNHQLEEYQTRLANIGSIEEIDHTLNKLKGFIEEFAGDDPRRQQTNQLMNNYMGLYSNISLEETDKGDNYICVGLFLGNKPISCTKKPTLKSNCVTKFSIRQQENKAFRIEYNAFNCYEEDENFIEVRFLLGLKVVYRKCFIKK